jgi:Protein of unknown function (DUF4058)
MSHSPFPGMDPYLEAPSIWPDVHTNLMSIFREQLAPLLAPKYLAELMSASPGQTCPAAPRQPQRWRRLPP